MTHLRKAIGPHDHALGPENASVTLVEYGDYECPHCGRAYPIVADVVKRMGNHVRFAFRHFPLQQIHPHALAAAMAAEAAGAQGQFWAMHAMLFERQDALELDDLVSYAGEIGLDVARFTEELRAGTYLQKVEDDFSGGVRSGVNGTPTFFINEQRYDESWDGESLLAALRSAGAQKRG
jgi:protein-disulfide isomerase